MRQYQFVRTPGKDRERQEKECGKGSKPSCNSPPLGEQNYSLGDPD